MSVEFITLHDGKTGTSAQILAGFGFNCFSFRAMHRGQGVELLYAAPDFAARPEHGTGSGIPLLFPFPGRMRGTRLRYGGCTYDLEARDHRGNAIHGFVLNRPWEVLEHTAKRVVAWFQASQVEPRLLDCWPADFRLTATYELRGNALAGEFLIENPDDRPLPWGFGAHPYFRVPLASEADAPRRKTQAGQCHITVPAGEYWELVDMLPTGRRLPAAGPRDLAHGLEFAAAQLDDVFTRLEFHGETCTADIHDPRAGATLTLQFDRPFNTCVVYNPSHREAICIEPYTCVPGRFGEGGVALEEALAILPAGESVRLSMRIELRSS